MALNFEREMDDAVNRINLYALNKEDVRGVLHALCCTAYRRGVHDALGSVPMTDANTVAALRMTGRALYKLAGGDWDGDDDK